MPRVSVVIPYYMSHPTIGATLNSVAAQTFRDFEVIVVDDGSPEIAGPHVERFRESLPALSLVEKANGGTPSARNAGIAASSGEYIAPLDGDDIWHPSYLEEMVRRLDATGAAMAYSPCRLVNLNDDLIGTHIGPRIDGWALHRMLTRNFVYTGSSIVYRRKAGDRFGHYDETNLRSCDYLLQILLLARGTAATVPQYLVGYRLVPGSMSKDPAAVAADTLATYGSAARLLPGVHRATLRRGLAGYLGAYARGLWPARPWTALRLLGLALIADPVSVADRMFGKHPSRPRVTYPKGTSFWSVDPAGTELLEPGDPRLRRDFLDAERHDAAFRGLP